MTPAEMLALGERLTQQLQPNDLIVLSGPLGAGKTTLTQGIGAGLEVEGEITSPTFVIAREHPGRVPLIHVDAYRLRPDGGGTIDPLLAMEDLDLDINGAVVVMEWGEGLGEILSPDYLAIDISIMSDDEREVTITGHGQRWAGFAW